MDKRLLILEKAEEMFASVGFEATSIRELAKLAGVNIAMISYYFGSKEKLFEEVIITKAAYMVERVQDLNNDSTHDSFEKLEILIHLYVERFYEQPNYYKICQRELYLQQRLRLHDNINEILDKNSYELKKLVIEGIQKGAFREVDEELVISTIMGTIMNAFKKHNLKNSSPLESETENFKTRLKQHLYLMLKSYLKTTS